MFTCLVCIYVNFCCMKLVACTYIPQNCLYKFADEMTLSPTIPLSSPTPTSDHTLPVSSPTPTSDHTLPVSSPTPTSGQTLPVSSQSNSNTITVFSAVLGVLAVLLLSTVGLCVAIVVCIYCRFRQSRKQIAERYIDIVSA